MSVRRAQDERLEGTPDGLNAITEISDVPDAPTIGTATAGAEQATVTFTAAATGGSVTTYRALSTPGSIAGTSATSPITVSGLTAGTAYTFQVRGENSTGNSAYSSASNSVTPTVPNSFESIATTTVGSGGASSVTFSSIPGTYSHLQLRISGQTSSSGTGIEWMVATINGDGNSANYALHNLTATGTSLSAGTSTSSSGYGQFLGRLPQGNSNRPWSGMIIDILNYANTNTYTTFRSLCGYDSNGGENYLEFRSMLWMNTSAITSIKLDVAWGQYSKIALYGKKGT